MLFFPRRDFHLTVSLCCLRLLPSVLFWLRWMSVSDCELNGVHEYFKFPSRTTPEYFQLVRHLVQHPSTAFHTQNQNTHIVYTNTGPLVNGWMDGAPAGEGTREWMEHSFQSTTDNNIFEHQIELTTRLLHLTPTWPKSGSWTQWPFILSRLLTGAFDVK